MAKNRFFKSWSDVLSNYTASSSQDSQRKWPTKVIANKTQRSQGEVINMSLFHASESKLYVIYFLGNKLIDGVNAGIRSCIKYVDPIISSLGERFILQYLQIFFPWILIYLLSESNKIYIHVQHTHTQRHKGRMPRKQT